MELALPITVYWDLSPDTQPDALLLRCCDEIIECRPLMLQLYDPSAVPGEGVRAILERFRGTPVSVSLTVTASWMAASAAASLDLTGVKELLTACDKLKSLTESPRIPEEGLSFFVNRDNWRELPDVVGYCREHGIHRLVLPMQRLYNGEKPFYLSRDEQEVLERSLAAVGGVEGFRLTIHDPFLWRALNPGIPFPQGGCQAANTMIAVSPAGGVYPCPTLPVKLGETGTATLKEIILSPLKKEFRRSLLLFPAACSSCLEIDICRGGCRGRSYVMNGSFDAVDEACR